MQSDNATEPYVHRARHRRDVAPPRVLAHHWVHDHGLGVAARGRSQRPHVVTDREGGGVGGEPEGRQLRRGEATPRRLEELPVVLVAETAGVAPGRAAQLSTFPTTALDYNCGEPAEGRRTAVQNDSPGVP